MHVLRQLTVVVLMGAIGLPACLGMGLHWLQADCCDHSLGNVSDCDCPFDHHAFDRHQSDQHGCSVTAHVTGTHDCSICDFLAIAKQTDQVDRPDMTLARLPIPCCGLLVDEVSDSVALTFLARGPPSRLPA